MLMKQKSLTLPTTAEALPGRPKAIPTSLEHAITKRSIHPPFPAGLEEVQLGLGCFWGAERKFWQQAGVWVTAVGYGGGITPNPTYEEVCSGRTGHTELVRVVFDPAVASFEALLKVFFESHDPTQGMRQGGDIGTQYRSAIFTTSEAQLAAAEAAVRTYGAALGQAGFSAITTEVRPAPAFYYAEDYHQQYLHKNPNGYCGIGGTGVACQIGVGVAAG
jgi:peptide-methionine (S)-S-oxide reductase